jgi:uncharacterized protein (DUF4415 family)
MTNPDRIRVVTLAGVTYRKYPGGRLEPLSTALGLEAESASMTDWARAELADPQKTPVTIRLDQDLVQWFKAKGPRYQTRINSALRRYVEAQR